MKMFGILDYMFEFRIRCLAPYGVETRVQIEIYERKLGTSIITSSIWRLCAEITDMAAMFPRKGLVCVGYVHQSPFRPRSATGDHP